MPNCIVHYTFAKQFALDRGVHFDATAIGAQGPDPWFFFGMLPWRKRPNKKSVRSLGGVTQHMEMTEPYWAMIEYARSSEDKDLLFAYIDGLFMHYAVDRACHPYVFYFTGFTDRPQDPPDVQRYYNYGHLYFENILDVIIGKREGTFSCQAKKLRLSKRDLLAISKMWDAVNRQVQKIEGVEPDSFYKTIRDYRSTARITYSPLGIKKWFLKLFCGKLSYAHLYSAPRNLKGFENCDFLNAKHGDWYMPDGTGSRNESFDDLLQEAGKTYSLLHDCLMRAKGGEDTKDEIDRIGNHINHEGIVPDSPKLCWKLIWPESFEKDIIEPDIKK